MPEKYRKFAQNEIVQLKQQGCEAEKWGNIEVHPEFDILKLQNVRFSGKIKLGLFYKSQTLPGGVTMPSGIWNARIHNCTIGNNVAIRNIHNYLANYDIENDVTIENVALLAVTEETTFGNGVEINVLIESGGREIPVFDRLSAQIAYLLTFYRHRTKLINRLKKIIAHYCGSVKANRGRIGAGSTVLNCSTIINVRIGVATTIQSAVKLENGSINSNENAPVYVGHGVIAENFIFSSGSRISDNVVLSNCFVGQGCRLQRQFSAENSLFFANCEGYHGEACSIFAGPYTTTHHKATLLIAGYYSFYNAGSATNNSNHLYKLGPLHQGILERGCKSGSSSYLLWPARVGAFSLVLGKHCQNFDSRDFPFSYLIGSKNESILLPGINARGIGTFRDSRKWGRREKRTDPDKLDRITFSPFNPYIAQKIRRGLAHLREFESDARPVVRYQGIKLNHSAIQRGIQYYELILKLYLGKILLKRLGLFLPVEPPQLSLFFQRDEETVGEGDWVDLGGFILPDERVQQLIEKIETRVLTSLKTIQTEFQAIHREWENYEWNWVRQVILQEFGWTAETVTGMDLIRFLEQWKRNLEEQTRMRLNDARKEFTPQIRIGFGIDGDATIQQQDFAAVRGKFDDNPALQELLAQTDIQIEMADAMIQTLTILFGTD